MCKYQERWSLKDKLILGFWEIILWWMLRIVWVSTRTQATCYVKINLTFFEKCTIYFVRTLNPRRLSTTHASRASLPIVTVTFGTGSANCGNRDSEKSTWKENYSENAAINNLCVIYFLCVNEGKRLKFAWLSNISERWSFFKSSCINFYVTPFVRLIGSCVGGYLWKQKYKAISGSTCVILASC